MGEADAPAIAVRLAAASDADAVAELRWALRVEAAAPVEDHAAFVARCREWFVTAWNGGDWLTFVAEHEGRPVGMVTLHVVAKVPNPVGVQETLGYLTAFYVDPALRNGGVGRRLLAELVAEARRREMECVVLWPTERSIPLYRRVGFDTPAELLELRLWESPPDAM